MNSIDLLLMSVSERALLYDVVSEYYLKLMWLTLFFYVLELLVYIVSFEFFKTKGAPYQKYTTQIKKLTRGCHLPGILFVFGNQRTDRRMSALAHDKRNFPACVFASSRFVGNSAKRKKFIKVLIETPL